MRRPIQTRSLLAALLLVSATSVTTPAHAATPEGTIAALLMQVIDVDGLNPGSVSGTGFSCNVARSNAAFDGDFPEAGPCLRFFSSPQVITVAASSNAGFVFDHWDRDCSGTNPVFTLSTESVAFQGIGAVPNCLAVFRRSACFVPPDTGGGDIVAGQVEECPADDPDDPVDCPENAIVGDENANTIDGTEGDDVICGLGGNDTINGLGGSDLIFGGSGSDEIIGGDGDDVLVGDSGDDFLFGGAGNDALLGGTGDDGLNGEAGNDALAGGAGVDVMAGAGGNDSLMGGDGNDHMVGGPGDDQIDGQAGRDTIFGCGGSDKLTGGAGNDSLFGDFDDAEGGCQLGAGEPGAGNANPARDVLIGGRGDDNMFGNGGNDTLRGLEGDDRFNGGAGNDVMRGGAGFDVFVANDGNTDAIHGGADCDSAGGFFDQGLDVLLSVEQPDDLCIIPLP